MITQLDALAQALNASFQNLLSLENQIKALENALGIGEHNAPADERQARQAIEAAGGPGAYAALQAQLVALKAQYSAAVEAHNLLVSQFNALAQQAQGIYATIAEATLGGFIGPNDGTEVLTTPPPPTFDYTDDPYAIWV